MFLGRRSSKDLTFITKFKQGTNNFNIGDQYSIEESRSAIGTSDVNIKSTFRESSNLLYIACDNSFEKQFIRVNSSRSAEGWSDSIFPKMKALLSIIANAARNNIRKTNSGFSCISILF